MLFTRVLSVAVALALTSATVIKRQDTGLVPIISTLARAIRKNTQQIILFRATADKRTDEQLRPLFTSIADALKNATTSLKALTASPTVDDDTTVHEANLVIDVITAISGLGGFHPNNSVTILVPSLADAVTTLDADLSDEVSAFKEKSTNSSSLLNRLLIATRENLMRTYGFDKTLAATA